MILHPALLRGREWCVHHLPKSELLFGGGLDRRGGCRPSRPRHCRRRPGGGSSCAPGQDVPDCLSQLLCNCWAKFSTALPKRQIWDTGAFRNRALSASMSARHSQRWRSWTTMVDIARPRDRAVTFVARGPWRYEAH